MTSASTARLLDPPARSARNVGPPQPAPAPCLLAVDDDETMLALVRIALGRSGLHVETAVGGLAGLRAFEELRPDVVTLDVTMPDVSGWEVLRRIRETSDVPVMFVSGRDGEVDRVRGLDLGADDYVTKPFSLLELEARVHALLRRAARTTPRRGALAR